MQSSIFLAKLIGPVLLVAGVGMLIHPAGYLAMADDFMRSPSLIYLGAILGLLGGIALVLAHNVWTAEWRVILTLLGWVSIAESAFWLLLPQQAQGFAATIMTPALPIVSGIIVALLGAVLCYFGYAATGRIGRQA